MVQLGYRRRWRGSQGDGNAGRREERSKQNLLFLNTSKTKMCFHSEERESIRANCWAADFWPRGNYEPDMCLQ